MITVHNSLEYANMILAQIRTDSRFISFDCELRTYQSRNEHGYTLIIDNRAITFCGYREDDKLAVYCGSYKSHGVSDDAFANKRLFGVNEIEAIIDYILWLILSFRVTNMAMF